MAGGGAQMTAGAVAMANLEFPVIAQVGGAIAMAHGASDWEIGSRQCFTGQRGENSLFQQSVSATARLAGADRQTADRIGTGADIVAGFVTPAGPMTGAPGAALATAANGERLAVAGAGAATLPERLADASGAIHATSVMMSVNGGDGDERADESDETEFRRAAEVKPEDAFPSHTQPTGPMGGKPFGEAGRYGPSRILKTSEASAHRTQRSTAWPMRGTGSYINPPSPKAPTASQY